MARLWLRGSAVAHLEPAIGVRCHWCEWAFVVAPSGVPPWYTPFWPWNIFWMFSRVRCVFGISWSIISGYLLLSGYLVCTCIWWFKPRLVVSFLLPQWTVVLTVATVNSGLDATCGLPFLFAWHHSCGLLMSCLTMIPRGLLPLVASLIPLEVLFVPHEMDLGLLFALFWKVFFFHGLGSLASCHGPHIIDSYMTSFGLFLPLLLWSSFSMVLEVLLLVMGLTSQQTWISFWRWILVFWCQALHSGASCLQHLGWSLRLDPTAEFSFLEVNLMLIFHL